MPVNTFVALDIANYGAPARLSIEALTPRDTRDVGIVLGPETSGDGFHEAAARESFNSARLYTTTVLGWPMHKNLRWNISRVRDDRPIPDINGPSLFGAFSMAFMQSLVLEEPTSVRPWTRCLWPALSGLCLNKVAISCDFSPMNGGFVPVGSIELKLRALARLGVEMMAVCVVAKRQPIELKVNGTVHQSESLRRSRSKGP